VVITIKKYMNLTKVNLLFPFYCYID